MKKAVFLTFLAIFCFTYASDLEKSLWRDYQKLLDDVVITNEFKYNHQTFFHSGVDYHRLYDSKNENLIEIQLKKLRISNPESIKENRTALAFWINVYNFFTLLEIKKHYPISSMKKIGWDNKVVTINGKKLTLDEVEHDIIRPLKEPRIHFAINCASVSCPSLYEKIYEGDILDQQLDFVTRNALKNPLNLKIDESFFGTRKMYVSKIFSWFDEDFGNQKSTLKFIYHHSTNTYRKYRNFGYITYNWDINTPQNIKETLDELLSQLSQ